jgi:ribonuclease Z
LSHGHVDHRGALSTLLGIRALHGKTTPPALYMPAEICEQIQMELAVSTRMQRWELAVRPVPMEPGDEVAIRSDLHVRAFRTHHPVPSLGYQFFQRVQKLRPEFQSLPGPEIGARRKAGEDLFDTVERLELAYATDTLVRVFDTNPSLFKSRVLIVECTFLDDRKSREASRQGCHIHLDELLERASEFENEAIVLMHFSQLYDPPEVHRLLERRCPPSLRDRLVVLAPRGRHWPG